MASANLQKHMSKTACCGISRHNYRDGRNHSNPDIDPTRSHLNRHYGPQTSAEFRERYHSMVKEFVQRIPPKRKKQDRKTSLGINIPSPREGMTPEQEAAWSEAAYRKIEELFPGQVVGGTYHADEIHKYIANGEEHTSRGHTHVEVIPWHPEKGLNMDAFYKRSLPNKINEALDELCQEMFGIPYRDGSQAKSRGTVEQMKVESLTARAEKLQKSVGDLRKRETAAVNAVGALDKQIEEKQKEVGEIGKALERLQQSIQHLLQQLLKLKPKEREKEKDLFDWLEKHGKVMGKGSLAEITKAADYIEQQSSRLESTYLSIDDDDDFELG